MARAGTQRRAPDEVSDLPADTWWGVLKRTVREFRDDNLVDWAAALTFYAVLSLFPALIVLISMLGLVGQSATQPLLDNLGRLAPGAANDIVTGVVRQIEASQGAAGVAFAGGLAVALWTASGYVGAFSRAANAIYEIDEGRPFWKLRPAQIAITVLMILLLAMCAIAVVITGPLAREVGDVIGAGDTAVTAWDVAKWPVIALVVVTMFAILYWATPNVKQPGFRWITPGGTLALVLWIAASLAFAFYVANFGSYNRTYGSLAGVVIFLIWLWISNLAILLGAELNAEVERGRQLEAGVPEERTIEVQPRADPGS